MEITLEMLLILCPLVFLAGVVDAIGGGGGLISLPAYMIAGLPPHVAIANNKMSATFGTALVTMRFFKEKLISMKLAAPAIVAAVIGSSIGANLSMRISEDVMRWVLIVILPASAFLVLNKKLFHDRGTDEVVLNKRTYITASIAALIIGIYDGFYGPGTGTFLIIAFTVFAHMDVKTANAQAKIINITTNITSLTIFLLNGQVLIPLGILMAACNMLGGYIGAGLALQNGAKLARYCILFVLFLLALKVLGIY